ncbi:Pentatricopeptide repeat-containing protein [Vitis vinifera]|uniref:Pentatricopeptide repeat-containing protein n=1 Tax=Vitis vinifera TaxID=29760 RepID=A0A438IVB8_VITVI|nr:Pentatricopeptide repeat-containing protein [Vitis vinifera]
MKALEEEELLRNEKFAEGSLKNSKMPPQPQPPKPISFTSSTATENPQNRPTVHGDSPKALAIPPSKTPCERFFDIAKNLSPIARYICDSFRKHRNWGPPVVADLNKLRRVTPVLVAEVLKVQTDPVICSKFFHWAGKQKGYKHNFASYNAFAYCLNRSNQFRAADQVPELMNMQGKPPSEKQFEILIRMHIDANRGLRVYYVYEKMKKFGIKPRVFLYNRIMDGLVKTGHLDLAMSVYEDFKEDGLVEESVTYMIWLKGYVLVAEGNLDGCLRVWEEMRKDKVEPDVMAYTTLVAALCNGNRVGEGFELFKEMKQKKYLIDRAIYGSLIEGFVVNERVGSACDLLKDLMDSGYRADLAIYNSLIEGMCNVKQVDKAYKLFQVTVHESLEPNFLTVKPMLVSYAEMKRMDDFCSLLGQMQKLGFPVIDDLSKFFSVMIEKGERLKLALEVFEHLKAKGYCSISIYNILMEAIHRTGEVKKALSLFDDIKDSNFKPDSSTYSNAIICFVEVGDVQEACACYNKIIEMCQLPSVAAYRSLVKGLCKSEEIDAAIMLVRDCLANVTSGPMEFKYTLTILHACKSGNAEKVIDVLNEMMQEGCTPDEVTYSALISGMCKHGTLEEARKVFSNMRERKLLTEANVIVYDEILIEHMKKKTADLVLSGLKFFGLESKLRSKGSTLLPIENSNPDGVGSTCQSCSGRTDLVEYNSNEWTQNHLGGATSPVPGLCCRTHHTALMVHKAQVEQWLRTADPALIYWHLMAPLCNWLILNDIFFQCLMKATAAEARLMENAG